MEGEDKSTVGVGVGVTTITRLWSRDNRRAGLEPLRLNVLPEVCEVFWWSREGAAAVFHVYRGTIVSLLTGCEPRACLVDSTGPNVLVLLCGRLTMCIAPQHKISSSELCLLPQWLTKCLSSLHVSCGASPPLPWRSDAQGGFCNKNSVCPCYG